MEIIRDLTGRLDYRNPVVTIGNFDGVHLGHQKIFSRVVDKAEEISGTPMAITFAPHPVRVLAPERGLKLIITYADKKEFIERMGIKVLICIAFSKDFAHTDPDAFIKNTLVDAIGAKCVIVGHSYSFGKGKKGTTATLRGKGKKYGFRTHVVRSVKVYGDVVSSSRIRSLLLRGRVCEASRMLGRAYHISGTVIKGAGRGDALLRTPTANITTANELMPKDGVYAVRVSLDGQDHVYDGAANIGVNPTFDGKTMSCEIHLFDFNRNLLGEPLRLHFIDRIRDEKKFTSVQELKDQIDRDITQAKKILSLRSDRLFL